MENLQHLISRTQLNSLTHKHQKDVEHIKNAMQVFKCESCKSNQASNAPQPDADGKIEFNPIGVIKTMFPEKRAGNSFVNSFDRMFNKLYKLLVPRQANVAAQISSKVELLPGVFTNPLHSLEGLEEFSHIWLIYHFHKNEPHTKAKISPPRLEGEKVGVFCTRSPHRPNPIGISLVQLERVEGSSIYFLGTDMVNDTPVLDIKPYIPQYDNPTVLEVPSSVVAQREEPEGEETVSQHQQQNSSVRVPQWVSNKKELTVEFNDTALGQLSSLNIDKVSFNKYVVAIKI